MSQIIAFSIITLVLILIFYYLKDIFIAIAAELSTNEKSLKLEFFNFYKVINFPYLLYKNSKIKLITFMIFCILFYLNFYKIDFFEDLSLSYILWFIFLVLPFKFSLNLTNSNNKINKNKTLISIIYSYSAIAVILSINDLFFMVSNKNIIFISLFLFITLFFIVPIFFYLLKLTTITFIIFTFPFVLYLLFLISHILTFYILYIIFFIYYFYFLVISFYDQIIKRRYNGNINN